MIWVGRLLVFIAIVGLGFAMATPPVGGPDVIINGPSFIGQASVMNSTPTGTEYGLVVRPIGGAGGGGGGGGVIADGNAPGLADVGNTHPIGTEQRLYVQEIIDPSVAKPISGTVGGLGPHDAPVAGNPVVIGCRSSNADPANVADNEASYVRCDQDGQIYIANPGATNLMQGDVAHDGVDSGNPVKIGGQARTSLPTAVANADRVNAAFDKFGRLLVLPQGPRDLVVQGTITLTNTTETTILAAIASTFLDLTYMRCTNGSATKVRVDIRDATGGTVRDGAWLAADAGGFSGPLPVPFTQTTANNNWTVQLSAAVTDVRCTFQAVKNL